MRLVSKNILGSGARIANSANDAFEAGKKDAGAAASSSPDISTEFRSARIGLYESKRTFLERPAEFSTPLLARHKQARVSLRREVAAQAENRIRRRSGSIPKAFLEAVRRELSAVPEAFDAGDNAK